MVLESERKLSYNLRTTKHGMPDPRMSGVGDSKPFLLFTIFYLEYVLGDMLETSCLCTMQGKLSI